MIHPQMRMNIKLSVGEAKNQLAHEKKTRILNNCRSKI